MASDSIGKVKSGMGKSVEVFWDKSSKEVYVAFGGRTILPSKATSAMQAANMAEIWLKDK